MKTKTTHGDKGPNPRNKYNLTPETARVGVQIGKVTSGVLQGDLAANPFRLSLKNPTEWRARLPLGGLAAAQHSPKCLKILPSGEPDSHSGA